jgi:hypothetical protein
MFGRARRISTADVRNLAREEILRAQIDIDLAREDIVRAQADIASAREAAQTDTTAAWPEGIMRFLTQGGAEVHVTENGTFEHRGFSNIAFKVTNHRWKCLGCGGNSDFYTRLDESDARDKANAHAAACRALPRPTA